VITDFGILEPDVGTRELVLTGLHPGMSVEGAQEATGWPLRVADEVITCAPPADAELAALRALEERA
jgi:glutaconate CoA-transferase, subunit B